MLTPKNEYKLKNFDSKDNDIYSTTYNTTYSAVLSENGVELNHAMVNQKRNYEHQKKNLVKKVELPCSKRVLDSSLRPEEDQIKKRYNSTNRANTINPGNFNSLMIKTDNEESITGCRKVSNAKVYKSINVLCENNETEPIRRILSQGEYRDYSRTTQIVALPGGLKRDQFKIKDDKKFVNKTNQGYLYKIERDYNSNIGLGANQQNSLTPQVFPTEKRFGKYFDRHNRKVEELIRQTQDGPANSLNSFNISHKIENEGFGIPSGSIAKFERKKRPEMIMNAFKSQIELK